MYYTLALNAGSLAGDLYLNVALMGVVEIPAIVLLVVLNNSRAVGRRYTTSFGMLLAGASGLILVPLILHGGI